MIRVTWHDPNFRFHAEDKDGHDYEHFTYAASDAELRQRLVDSNLRVDWIQPYNFDEWKKRAKKATDRAIAAHASGKKVIPFNATIWAELKCHLFDLFHQKCAYCESYVWDRLEQDVEHYRPKSKVDEDPTHPGYYWLAYDPTNLLPSCKPCNETRGKMTHFPVEPGTFHVRDPQQNLNQERPLLLYPYDVQVDPFDHLEFDSVGMANARETAPGIRSEHGEKSRIFYHLNRRGLGVPRRAALAKVNGDWHTMVLIVTNRDTVRNVLVDEIKLGVREYSAAQLWELGRITGPTGPLSV